MVKEINILRVFTELSIGPPVYGVDSIVNSANSLTDCIDRPTVVWLLITRNLS